jgi:hypothetical protein
MDDLESLNHSVWDCKLCIMTHNLHHACVGIMRAASSVDRDSALKSGFSELSVGA